MPRVTPTRTSTPSRGNLFGCNISRCQQGDSVSGQWDAPRYIRLFSPYDASLHSRGGAVEKQWSLVKTRGEILNFASRLPSDCTHFSPDMHLLEPLFAFLSAASYQSRVHWVEPVTVSK